MDGLEFDSSETEVEEYAEELREIERKQKMRDKLREEAKKRLEEKKAKEEAAKRDKKDGLEGFLQGMKDWVKDDEWMEESDEKIDGNSWFKTKKKQQFEARRYAVASKCWLGNRSAERTNDRNNKERDGGHADLRLYQSF